ncbi:MAG: hypothetical protein AB7N54_17985 [Alphaproteobacteria bacterium]
MNDLSYLTTGFQAAKSALDLLRSFRDLLPAGPQRERAEQKITDAETALAAGEAQMAQALGFKLCRCTFPPQIMLWRESAKADVCPACGHAQGPARAINLAQRGGPGSWMS